MSFYTIGQLAKQVNISTDTVRMYEKIKLIEKPSRGINHYRQYDQKALLRLKFIKRAKGVGFTLKEISELLALKTTSLHTCEDVRKKTEVKLRLIEDKLNELQRLKIALNGLISSCHNSQNNKECPMLTLLEQETDT